jgi:protein-L-isoaspartate(D-aspartate) O-methyltransferase
MEKIPRESFIDPALKQMAYDDDALPIGHNQTISSPYIVAKMSQIIIEEDKMDKVLEIGTGCSYQTVVLSYLFKKVVSIERIKSLYIKSKKIVSDFNRNNIKLIFGDGYMGSKIDAPFDAIIITAAPNEIPKSLIEQLKTHGRMIMPLNKNGKQILIRIKNTPKGIILKEIDDVLFVPMLKGIIQ